jgi:aminoglycoside phosphotransferase (APT) family kinase protein
MTNTVSYLDNTRLSAYLEAHLPGFRGPMEIRQFPAGRSNPTFLIQARSGRYVMRRQPPGLLLKSAHAVDREYRVIRALAETAVPVPRALHLCLDPAVIGSLFFVMAFEEGRIFSFQHLPEVERRKRRSFYEAMIRALAVLHTVSPGEVGLADYGKPGNYFERQMGRMTRQYRATETETLPAMEALMHWLAAHTPPDDGKTSLIHGDFHFSNVIFHPDKPQIKALLDWELSTLGHPLADLGYFCMGLRLPESYVIRGLAGKDRRTLGLPEEPEIVSYYAGLRGLGAIDRWVFYLAFAFFRLAAIVQGVVKRGTDGNASHREEALRLGEIPARLAGMALEVIEKGH